MATICEICNSHIEPEYINKHKSFAQLVSESGNKSQTNSDDTVSEKSEIISWLLHHASNTTINPSHLKNIVNNCMLASDVDITEILKQHGVCITIDEKLLQCDLDWETSAMYFAITHGQMEVISWLLNHNTSQKLLNRILHESVKANEVNIMINILNLGADINSKDSRTNDCSIIDYACIEGYLTLVQWIVVNKFIDLTPELLANALSLSILHERYAIAEYLVSKGATVTYEVMCNAVEIGHIGVLIWLVEKGGKLCLKKAYRKKSLLHIAAYFGRLDVLKWLVSKGGDVNACDDTGNTVLYLASYADHFECVEYLVHQKCKVHTWEYISKHKNIADSYISTRCKIQRHVNDYTEYQSPIQAAVCSGNMHIVKFLTKHGADLKDKKCMFNKTLLHSAAYNLEMMKELVSLGLDVHAKTYNDVGLLNCVGKYNDPEAAKWLLAQGLPIIELIHAECNNWKTKEPTFLMLHVIIEHLSDINMQFQGVTLLHRAVKCLEAVKILLQNKANVNVVNQNDNSTPLILALCINEGLEVAKYLLSKGADISVKKTSGENALYYAIQHEDLAFINELIALGADVNAVSTQEKSSVLIKAVTTGNLEMVKLIFQSGADINLCTSKNKSALNFAGEAGYWDIVKYLVKNGADITNKPLVGDEVIINAIRAANLELTFWLADRGGLIYFFSNTIHEIKWFKNESDKLKLIELFMRHGYNINAHDVDNNSLLHLNFKHMNIVKLLARYKIDLNLRNKSGRTALHLCVDAKAPDYSIKNIKVVLKLLQCGANVNTKDNKGLTPLHSAVADPIYPDIALLLVKYGAKINARDHAGNTVLHKTVQGDLAIRFCKRRGVNINAVNKRNNSVLNKAVCTYPLHKSTSNIVLSLNRRQIKATDLSLDEYQTAGKILCSKSIRLIEYLVPKVTNIDKADSNDLTALCNAATYGNIAVFEMIRARSSTFKLQDKDGCTMLLNLCNENNCDAYLVGGTYYKENLARHDHLPMITHILKHMNEDKAQFKADNSGETALLAAVRSERFDTTKLLLEHGIDVNHKNKKEETALHLAVEPYTKNFEISKLLLEHGIDVNQKDEQGETALHLAVYANSLEIFKLLVEHGADIYIKNDKNRTALHLAVRLNFLDILTYVTEQGINLQEIRNEVQALKGMESDDTTEESDGCEDYD